MPSSPPDDCAAEPESGREPVELFLIGRTLRGTLGDAFRREAIALFESRHGGTDAEPHTSISRTVELTAVIVARAGTVRAGTSRAGTSRAGTVRVDVAIADPAFRSALDPAAVAPAAPGEQVFEVDVDALPGLRPVPGPPGVDRSRRAVVRVRTTHPLEFHVNVLH